jgi:hypothetical protein
MKFIQQCRLSVICADDCIPNDKFLKQTVFIENLCHEPVPLTILKAMQYIVVDVECSENFLAAVAALPSKLRIKPIFEVGKFTLISIMHHALMTKPNMHLTFAHYRKVVVTVELISLWHPLSPN